MEISAIADDNPSSQRASRPDRQQGPQGRRDNWPGGARPKTNRNFQNAPQQNKSQGSSSSQNSRRYVCYSCGRQGHVARFCRFKGNNSQQRSGEQFSSSQRGQNSQNSQRFHSSNKNRGAFQTTSDPSSCSNQHRE